MGTGVVTKSQGNIRTKILIAAVCAGAVLASGCATVTRGTSQPWTVQTEPVGADVRLSTGETCKTPCTLKKKRKQPFTVELALDGYQPVTTDVVSGISKGGAWGMAGNALIGGVIGLGIDAGTGAAKDLTPNPLIVKLAPAAAAASMQSDGATPQSPPPDAMAPDPAGVPAEAAPAPAAPSKSVTTDDCVSCERIGKDR